MIVLMVTAVFCIFRQFYNLDCHFGRLEEWLDFNNLVRSHTWHHMLPALTSSWCADKRSPDVGVGFPDRADDPHNARAQASILFPQIGLRRCGGSLALSTNQIADLSASSHWR